MCCSCHRDDLGGFGGLSRLRPSKYGLFSFKIKQIQLFSTAINDD